LSAEIKRQKVKSETTRKEGSTTIYTRIYKTPSKKTLLHKKFVKPLADKIIAPIIKKA